MFQTILNTFILLMERELLKLEPEIQKMIIAKLSTFIEQIIALINEKLETCTQGHISYECDHNDNDEHQ